MNLCSRENAQDQLRLGSVEMDPENFENVANLFASWNSYQLSYLFIRTCIYVNVTGFAESSFLKSLP